MLPLGTFFFLGGFCVCFSKNETRLFDCFYSENTGKQQTTHVSSFKKQIWQKLLSCSYLFSFLI